MTEVTSSGADVPNATIVNPIIDSDTPKESAMFFADPTRNSAQTARPISPQST